MRIRLVTHPVWRYLNQQVCDRSSVWDFRRFWYLYKIELLKKCWQQEFTQESRPRY